MNLETKIDSGQSTSLSVRTLRKYARLFPVNVKLWLTLTDFQLDHVCVAKLKLMSMEIIGGLTVWEISSIETSEILEAGLIAQRNLYPTASPYRFPVLFSAFGNQYLVSH